MYTIIEKEPVLKVAPAIVHVSRYNTRQPTEEDVAELIEAIRVQGQITPAVARPHPELPGEFELIAGARRRTACLALGIELDLIVRPMSDEDLKDQILTDNLQREDPSPESEAELIGMRLAEGMTPEAIAAKYGKADIWVKRRMKLLEIVPELKALMEPGAKLSHYSTEMRERMGALPADVQLFFAKSMPYQLRGCQSMEELRTNLAQWGQKLEGCTWLDDPDTFVLGCGAGCATDTNKSVFPEPGGACGRCMNRDCFQARKALASDKAIEEALGGRSLEKVVRFSSAYGDVMYKGKKVSYMDHWNFDQSYRISKAKKGTDIVGIDLTDPAKPKLVFLIKKEKKRGAGGGDEGEKESREDKLTGKRLALMNGKLKVAIEASSPPADVPMLNLVAAFGLNDKRDSAWSDGARDFAWAYLKLDGTVPVFRAHLIDDDSDDEHDAEDDDDAPAPVSPAALRSREEVLWESIKPILKSRLFFHKNGDLLAPEKRREMLNVAGLIGYDYDDEWARICVNEVPVPKSWGKGFDPITLEKKEAA